MTLKERLSRIDDAIAYVEDAKAAVSPFQDSDAIDSVKVLLLTSVNELQEWYDLLDDDARKPTGREKQSVVKRLTKAKAILDDQIVKHDGDFPAAENARDRIDGALKALDYNRRA